MAESSLEFGLPAAIFIPFSGVPEDQPDRIDREERLIKTLQNLERDHEVVRKNIMYISSLRKDGLLKDSLLPSKKDSRVTAAKREALDVETRNVLASLRAPAEPGKTLADYDSRPDDFPLTPKPVDDLDVEMGDAEENLEQAVQRMLGEATPESKKVITDDYNDNTPPRVREADLRRKFDPVEDFYRKKAMENYRNERELKATQQALKDLKLNEWNSTGHRLTRLAEATVRELEQFPQHSRIQFYREALERERAKNGSTPIRFERPLAAAPPPAPPPPPPPPPPPANIDAFRTPTPRPLLAPAPPGDNSRGYNGNGYVQNQYPSIAPAQNDGFWGNGGSPMMHTPPNASPNGNGDGNLKAVDLNADERWLIYLKQTCRLPWKDIAKRYPENGGKNKNEAALQMQYKRLRDKIKEVHQAQYEGAQMNMPGLVQPGSIQPTMQPAVSSPQYNLQPAIQPMLGNAPQWSNTMPLGNIISAQPPAHTNSNVLGWTAINQTQPVQLPSELLPPRRDEPSVSTIYRYQPPQKSSIAPDHPNLAQLEMLLEHPPLNGARVDMTCVAMRTVPFTSPEILAIGEGENIRITHFLTGKTFQGKDSKGFIAKIHENTLWGDSRRTESNNPSMQVAAAIAWYMPPPVSAQHPNFELFKMLSENPIAAGQSFEVTINFTALKTVPYRGSKILALRVGEKITLVKYLEQNTFLGKNSAGHAARVSDEVIWGVEERDDDKPKVPDSHLEKPSQLLVNSDSSAPTAPKNPSLDSSISGTIRQQPIVESEPRVLEQIQSLETRHEKITDNTYNLPPSISANHPNRQVHEFLKFQPPLHCGANIYKDVVAMKQTTLPSPQHSIRIINVGDIITVQRYQGAGKFTFQKGTLAGVVNEDVIWGEPGPSFEMRDGSGNMATNDGGAFTQEKIQEDVQNSSKVSKLLENLSPTIASSAQDKDKSSTVANKSTVHSESIQRSAIGSKPNELGQKKETSPEKANSENPGRNQSPQIASTTTISQISPVAPKADSSPPGPAILPPNPNKDLRNLKTGAEGKIPHRRIRTADDVDVAGPNKKKLEILEGRASGDRNTSSRRASGDRNTSPRQELERHSRDSRDAVSVSVQTRLKEAQQEKLAKLFKNLPYEPGECLEPYVTLIALQDVPTAIGLLAVRKNDVVVLQRHISDLFFFGQNQRTKALGEVDIKFFVDDGKPRRDGGKRSRDTSLERTRESEWKARKEDVRVSREKDRAQEQEKLEKERQKAVEETKQRAAEEAEQIAAAAHKLRWGLVEEAKEKEFEEKMQRAFDEDERKENEEKERAAEEAKRKEIEAEKQTAAEEARQKEIAEKQQRAVEEAERKENEEKSRAAKEAKRKEIEAEKQRAAEEARQKEIAEKQQRAVEEAEKQKIEAEKQRAAEQAIKEAAEQKLRASEQAKHDSMNNLKLQEERRRQRVAEMDRDRREEREEEEELLRLQIVGEQENHGRHEQHTAAIHPSRASLISSFAAPSTTTASPNLHRSPASDQTRIPTGPQAKRQKISSLDSNKTPRMPAQPDDSRIPSASRAAQLPSPDMSRAPTEPKSDQLTVDELFADYQQGVGVDFYRVARKSWDQKGQLKVSEGDRVHLTKYIAGRHFLGENLGTDARGGVPREVFTDEPFKMKRSASRAGHEGSSSSPLNLRKRKLRDGDEKQESPTNDSAPTSSRNDEPMGDDEERRQESFTIDSSPTTLGNHVVSVGDDRDRGRGRGRRGRAKNRGGRGSDRGGRGSDRGGRGSDRGGRGRGARGRGDSSQPGRIGRHEVDESPKKKP